MRSWGALLFGLWALLSPAPAAALSRDKFVRLWTENGGVIPVCFEAGMTTLPDVKRRIVSALKDSWQKYLNIQFTEFDTCTYDPAQQRVRVLVKESTGWQAQTRGLGMQTLKSGWDAMSCTGSGDSLEKCRWSMSIAAPRSRFRNRHVNTWTDSAERLLRYDVVHEFGHVLGFVHEQDTARNWRLVLRPNPHGVPIPEPVDEIYCRPAVHTDSWRYQTLTRGFDISSIMIQGYCGNGHRASPNEQWSSGGPPLTGILSSTDISAAQAIYGRASDRVRQRVPR